MLKVAIIDDNVDVRQRIAKRIRRYLNNKEINWIVENYEPFERIEDYTGWIVKNKVIILIVDERLNVIPNKNGKAVNYGGHDIVRLLRKTNKQMPMYVITAYKEDDALQGMKGEFDGIVSRSDFSENEKSKQYIQRFVRATQSYLDQNQEEYNRLAHLSNLIALDTANDQEILELKGLQTKLGIPLTSLNINNRNYWLKELEEKTSKLEELTKKIEQFLKQ